LSTGQFRILIFELGWDNDCLGLVEMIKREDEWKKREAHNDVEVARWAVEAPNGWGNTPSTRPFPEGWPGCAG
jgi:hypothetical protein